MEWYLYPVLIAAGFLCGFINILAGSGSLVTLPVLIFLGLPANVANGTNRIAILMQNVVGTRSFRRQKVLDARAGLRLAIPAILGALLGARIAVELDEEVMRRVIGGLMVVMLVVLLLRPKRWLEGRPREEAGRGSWAQFPLFLAIGVYGGFIQAGVGIFLLAGLVLSAGHDLVRGNAIKVFIILWFTLFALVVFLIHGQVEWLPGLTLGIGTMLGAGVASRMAVKRGARFVRWVLVAVLIASAFVLLGGPDLFLRLFRG